MWVREHENWGTTRPTSTQKHAQKNTHAHLDDVFDKRQPRGELAPDAADDALRQRVVQAVFVLLFCFFCLLLVCVGVGVQEERRSERGEGAKKRTTQKKSLAHPKGLPIAKTCCPTLSAALLPTATGRSASSFPADFAGAIAGGKVGSDMLARYLELEAGFLTAWLMRFGGAFFVFLLLCVVVCCCCFFLCVCMCSCTIPSSHQNLL